MRLPVPWNSPDSVWSMDCHLVSDSALSIGAMKSTAGLPISSARLRSSIARIESFTSTIRRSSSIKHIGLVERLKTNQNPRSQPVPEPCACIFPAYAGENALATQGDVFELSSCLRRGQSDMPQTGDCGLPRRDGTIFGGSLI